MSYHYFDRIGASYEKGRPDYPEAAIDFLRTQFSLNSDATVLDVGAGTGKFTRLLVPTNANLIAVEPAIGMREQFENKLPSAKLISSTADKIPLASGSVDLIVVAQAFHWFANLATLREFHRLLKPGGALALIWNVRDESVPWVRKLSELIEPYEGSVPRYKSMTWREAFFASDLFSELNENSFSYTHFATPEVLTERYASVSFVAALAEPERTKVLRQVRAVLEAVARQLGAEKVGSPYQTKIFWCRKIVS